MPSIAASFRPNAVFTAALAVGGIASCSVETDLLSSAELSEQTRCSIAEPVGRWVAVTPSQLDVEPEGALAALVMDPVTESTLYLAASEQGIWKSEDCGTRWERVNTGINGPLIQDSQLWTMAQDRYAPNTLYTGPRFTEGGMWWSTNGGVHWEQILPREVSLPVSRYALADIARIAVSPFSAHHVLASSVDPWLGDAGNGDQDAGLFEGRYDEKAQEWEWTLHPPALGMAAAQRIAFGENESTWYVTATEFSEGRGTFRTTNGGRTFELVDTEVAALPGWQMYRSSDDTLYHTGATGLWRSVDDGDSWVDVFEGLGIGGTQAVVGDGERLYVSVNSRSAEAIARLYAADEAVGDRDWAPYGKQVHRFNFGPLVHDARRRVLYSLAEGHGVYRMRLE